MFHRPRPISSRFPLLVGLALSLGLIAAPSRADFVVSVQSVTASAGSTGNALDVTLTNTGPTSATFSGFSFGLAPALGLTFTAVTTGTTTAGYIFGDLGLFGSDITSTPPAGVAIEASDLYSVAGAGVTLASGATLGLGHVFFNVSAAATGSISVALAAPPATSLSSPAGTSLPVTRLQAGTVRIAASTAVPEPASALGLGVGLGALLVHTRSRRATARAIA